MNLSCIFPMQMSGFLQKTLNGYRKCASIAAHYGMSDVFDNLVIHLCKFSTLMSTSEGNTASFFSSLTDLTILNRDL